MKVIILAINWLLGLVLLTTNFQPSAFKSENLLGLLLGAALIVAAIAFQKNKKWANFVLPIIPLSLSIYLFVAAGRSEAAALVGGPMILFALLLFLFFAIETAYLVLRTKKQKPPVSDSGT